MKSVTYRSNGKLLISGEYVVLDGAKALALPTRLGQTLEVVPTTERTLHWTSVRNDGSVWFETILKLPSCKSLQQETTAQASAIEDQLITLVQLAQQANPEFLSTGGARVITQLEFSQSWGLGSSSTLINNIAQWASVDPYELLQKGFGGSGYDIAAARATGPIQYMLSEGLPKVTHKTLPWNFTNQLYFVHLNRKQSSRSAIEAYREHRPSEADITVISNLTEALVTCQEFHRFEAILREHEQHMGRILKTPPVQATRFPDYSGVVKSLGAWGGDFVLATARENPLPYFKSKGYETVLSFSEIIV